MIGIDAVNLNRARNELRSFLAMKINGSAAKSRCDAAQTSIARSSKNSVPSQIDSTEKQSRLLEDRNHSDMNTARFQRPLCEASRRGAMIGGLAAACCWIVIAISPPATAAAPLVTAVEHRADNASARALMTLGIGDTVNIQVYGRPELNTITYVSDDGTITVPLAGSVPVEGLSPAKAGQQVAAAFIDGHYLLDPQVTIFLVQYRSQQVSVLGAVRSPGSFPVESKTTVLDVLAKAGGTTENAANLVTLLRPDKDGNLIRYPIDLSGLSRSNVAVPTLRLRGGDSIFVPPADQFYVYGEVNAPNMYRLEPGMTVVQAVTRGGGITPRGSSRRIEIRRRKPDGTDAKHDGDLGEAIQANDVILVKERIF